MNFKMKDNNFKKIRGIIVRMSQVDGPIRSNLEEDCKAHRVMIKDVSELT